MISASYCARGLVVLVIVSIGATSSCRRPRATARQNDAWTLNRLNQVARGVQAVVTGSRGADVPPANVDSPGLVKWVTDKGMNHMLAGVVRNGRLVDVYGESVYVVQRSEGWLMLCSPGRDREARTDDDPCLEFEIRGQQVRFRMPRVVTTGQ